MTDIDTSIPDFLKVENRGKNVAPPQKPFVWGYTNLHTYDDVCPYQFFRTYIKRDIPYVATPEMEFGTRGHEAMERRVATQLPLPEHMRRWEPFAEAFTGLKARCEVKLGVTREGKPTGFFDKDVAGRGKADVVVLNNTIGAIFDWKFGNSKYEHPFELEIHAMMLKAQMPQLEKITGAYIWLKEDRVGQNYDLSDFNSTWVRVNNIVEKIEDNMFDGRWEKRRGPLCSWCRCFDCENNSNPKKP